VVGGKTAYIYDLQLSNVTITDTEISDPDTFQDDTTFELREDDPPLQDDVLDAKFALPFHFSKSFFEKKKIEKNMVS
jgi:hypothetical protein